MDAQAWFGMFGGGSLVLTVGIAIGLSRTRGRDLDVLGERVHKLTNRLNVYPERPDDVYARKDVIASRLDAFDASLKRIEAHQEMMAQRFMNGGAGS